jgi:hypothetical protein
MRSKALVGVLVLAVVSLFAGPAQARVYRVYGGHRYYVRPHHYHVHRGFVSFGFSRVYAPPPVYVAPPPAVYYAPPVVVPPPVVVAPAPVVVAPPAVERPVVVEQPARATPDDFQLSSGFVETNRRYHKHGDNKGLLDWVEGLLDGRPVRIYYDDFGRVEKQKWLD